MPYHVVQDNSSDNHFILNIMESKMADKLQKGIKTASWFLYLLIVFEIIYMITPFLAVVYYPKYGPALNFLRDNAATAWLTQFFLPHYAETSSIINPGNLFSLGSKTFLFGLVLFLIGAGQIYYAKFFKKGPVTGGLYKFSRNPQYVSFALMGLGTTIIWPRYIMLVMFVTMLFVYYYLAKAEEKECLNKFGDGFRSYMEKTPIFLPLRMPKLFNNTLKGKQRVLANFALYLTVIAVFLLTVTGIRNYSLTNISLLHDEKSATISVTQMDKNTMQSIMDLALESPEVREKLSGYEYLQDKRLLNYIVPLEWILADIPLEPLPEGTEGHITPQDYNRDEYKVLFTIAGFPSNGVHDGLDIVKNTVSRKPVIVVKLNIGEQRILGIDIPPDFVAWGDIPTPLF